MKKYGRLQLALLALSPMIHTSHSMADEGWISRMFSLERDKEVKPVSLKAYQEECSSCHYAYPPGLLPEASWKAQQEREGH